MKKELFCPSSKYSLLVTLAFTLMLIFAAGALAQGASPQGNLNINTADVNQLAALPGIGISKAEAIVKYRSENGPFPNVDSLASVNGIGIKILEKIRPFITTTNQ